MQSSALLIMAMRHGCSHFNFMLRELISQRQRLSERLHKPSVSRLNVTIKLDDKELIRQIVIGMVSSHEKPFPG